VESRSRRVSWKNRANLSLSLSQIISARRRDAFQQLARDFSKQRASGRNLFLARARAITRNLEPSLGIFRGSGRTCAASSKKSDRSPFLALPSLSLSLFRLFFPSLSPLRRDWEIDDALPRLNTIKSPRDDLSRADAYIRDAATIRGPWQGGIIAVSHDGCDCR